MIKYNEFDLRKNFIAWLLNEKGRNKPDYINVRQDEILRNRVTFYCHWVLDDKNINIDYAAFFKNGQFAEFKQITSE